MGQHPVRVITVEREYGSRGGEFAHELAARLGWRLLDSELPARAAAAAGVPAEMAAELDDRLDPWYYRYGKIFWQDTGYATAHPYESHIFDCERMFGLVRKEIELAAREGNCVIVGRGSACALNRQPGCFHIFVYATQAAKREWYAKAFPSQAAQAEHVLAEYDKRRAAVIRRFYGQEWNARGLYHLLLNSSMGLDGMIASACGAAGLAAKAQEPVAG